MEVDMPGMEQEMQRRRARQALERFAAKRLRDGGYVTIEDNRTSLEIALLEDGMEIDDNLVATGNQ